MNGIKEQCRWCGNMALLNGSGRCEVCDDHYRNHAVRAAKHGKYLGHYGCLALLILIGSLSAQEIIMHLNSPVELPLGFVPAPNTTYHYGYNYTVQVNPKNPKIYASDIGNLIQNPCRFDQSLGSVRCPINITNQTPHANVSREMQLANHFRSINMTPFKAQQQYDKFMAKQAKSLAGNETPSLSLPAKQTPAPMLNNSTIVVSQNRTVSKPCTTRKENDFMAFCLQISLEMGGIDCWNANKDTKDMIMRNMAEIRGCVYAE